MERREGIFNPTCVEASTLVNSDVLKERFKIYLYVTPDGNPGMVIVHPHLSKPFDEQKLMEMDKLVVSEISLADILFKGYTAIGDTDTMEGVDIVYPLIANRFYPNRKISGKHFDHTLQEIVSMFSLPDEINFQIEEGRIKASESDSDDLVKSNVKTNTEPIDYVDLGEFDTASGTTVGQIEDQTEDRIGCQILRQTEDHTEDRIASDLETFMGNARAIDAKIDELSEQLDSMFGQTK